jgi:ferredoxin
LRIAGPNAQLDALQGETVLDALERNGYTVESSCRAGTCGTCRLRVLAGQTRGSGGALTPAERAGGYVLSCVAEPVGDVTLAPHGIAFRPQTAGAVPASARRVRATKRLRWAVVAAGVTLFLGMWRVTQQVSAASVTGTNTNGSNAGQNDDNGSFRDGNGPSGVNTQPGIVVPSTGSGVS